MTVVVRGRREICRFLSARCKLLRDSDWGLGADVGSRGFFGHGDMQKEFEQAAFALKPGEVSGVVDTASGVHLIERYVVYGTARSPVSLNLHSQN